MESVASNRRIRKCYEYIDSYDFNKLDEKDKFFERYKLPNLTQEEVGQQDNSMLIKSMEFVALKASLQRKCQVLMSSLVNSYTHLRTT